MQGMTEQTAHVFSLLANEAFLEDYTLVGGTALAIQIGHRLSVDLDFMRWRNSRADRTEVDWAGIRDRLQDIGHLTQMNLIDVDHVEFVLDGVKVSFYMAPRRQPEMRRIHLEGSIHAADIEAIGAMKMEVLLRRCKFRDYYDLYSIVLAGGSFGTMVQMALRHSGHLLKSKNLYAMLTNSMLFATDATFPQLLPKYNVSPMEIECHFKHLIEEQRLSNTNNGSADQAGK